jgi:hypothetical protein
VVDEVDRAPTRTNAGRLNKDLNMTFSIEQFRLDGKVAIVTGATLDVDGGQVMA